MAEFPCVYCILYCSGTLNCDEFCCALLCYTMMYFDDDDDDDDDDVHWVEEVTSYIADLEVLYHVMDTEIPHTQSYWVKSEKIATTRLLPRRT
jgi:hypothetical protein